MKEFSEGFKGGMKQFGTYISAVINAALLLVTYIIGVGTTSIGAKICGKHFLERRIDNTESYWSDLNLKKEAMERYSKQF